MASKSIKFNNGWCFAIVNGKLAEIFFNEKKGIYGHCYVKKSEYKTKREQKMIEVDTGRYNFMYSNGVYKDMRRSMTISNSRACPPLEGVGEYYCGF